MSITVYVNLIPNSSHGGTEVTETTGLLFVIFSFSSEFPNKTNKNRGKFVFAH